MGHSDAMLVELRALGVSETDLKGGQVNMERRSSVFGVPRWSVHRSHSQTANEGSCLFSAPIWARKHMQVHYVAIWLVVLHIPVFGMLPSTEACIDKFASQGWMCCHLCCFKNGSESIHCLTCREPSLAGLSKAFWGCIWRFPRFFISRRKNVFLEFRTKSTSSS